LQKHKSYGSFLMKSIRLLLIALCSLPVSAVADSTITVYWNNTTLGIIQQEHTPPTQAARALAMVHTCIYDAWAAYDPMANSTVPNLSLRRPVSEYTESNKQQAISYAAYRCLSDQFPRDSSLIKSKLTALGYDPNDTSTDISNPTGIGNAVAQKIIMMCHHDGANQLGDLARGEYEDYSRYKPVNGPNRLNDPDRWQPLRVMDRDQLMIQTFLTPFWNRIVPFALTSADQFRPSPPYSWEKSRDGYIEQATELVEISAHLIDREKVIAEYWADGPGSVTPPGHWCQIAEYISAKNHFDIDTDVKLFFVLTNALFDTSISTWDAKRTYDSVRPITAIHFLFAGKKIQAWAGPYQGTAEMDGAEWRPYQRPATITPPFPEYVSGHSAFSAAAAEVLKLFTGSDAFGDSALIKSGSSKIEPGTVPAKDTVLSWDTFTDAADQAGMSRRYGGIHFKMADMNGRKLGRLVGAQAFKKALSYFNEKPDVLAN
jgi:hypothetical protein